MIPTAVLVASFNGHTDEYTFALKHITMKYELGPFNLNRPPLFINTI